MDPAGMDRFTAAGIAATWWEESFFDLQTAANRDWKAVIEAWLTTAEASQEDKKGPPLADQIAVRILVAPQLTERSKLATEHARLDAAIKRGEDHTTAEIRKLKSARAKSKKALKKMEVGLLLTARQNLNAMSLTEARSKAIGELRDRLEKLVTDHFAELERSVTSWYDNLVKKYGTTLKDLEEKRRAATAHLAKHLKRLGYG